MALTIEFNVDDKATSATKRLQKELGLLDPKIKQADKGMLGLNSSIAKLAVGYISLQGAMNLGSSLSRQADEFKNMESQLRLVTSSTQELTRTQKELFELAQNSRQDLGATTNLYARLARASQDLGTSQKDLLQVTDTINKALVVSGASTQEASSAITQLSQGLASGVLRGEEFNSITENGSRIARALADSLGVTIGELRAMAQEGKLTSEVVINALKGQASSINKEFSQMEMTIGQAMTTISTSITSTIGSLDKATGSSKLFAEELRGFSTIMDDNQDSIRNFAFFTFATVDRMVDGFDLLQESAELGIESLIAVPQIGLQQFIATIHEQIADLQMLANDAIGSLGGSAIFSDEEISNTLYKANVALESSRVLVKDLTIESKEVVESAKDFNITVEERVAKYNEEYQALLNNGEQIKKNNETSGAKGGLSDKELKALEKAQEALWQSKYEILSEEMAFEEELYQEKIANIEELKQATIDSLDQTSDSMTSMLDMQIELTESGMNWSDSLDGVAGSFSNISKAVKKLDLNDLKYQKADIKLQKDYAKSFLKANGDVIKEKELEAKFDADQSQLNKVRQSAEIAGYANLAGAMSQAFAEGSSAAKAFQGIQATLGIVNGFTAITSAWASAPFPANLPAVASATAAVLPIIGTLTSLGGSGGSGGASGSGGAVTHTVGTVRNDDYYDNALEIAEQTNKPILDKFDRQIELLEEISGYGGVGATASLNAALAEYTAQSRIDIINASSQGGATNQRWYGQSWSPTLHERLNSQMKSIIGSVGDFADNVDYWVSYTWAGDHTNLYQGGVSVDEKSFESAAEFVNFLEYLKENNLLATFGYTELEYENILNDFQNATNEFVTNLISDINSLTDFADELKGAFDDITATTKYEDITLSDAFADVNELIGDEALTDYIERQIKAIDDLESSLSGADIALLLSSNVEDFEAQQELIYQIQKDALATLDGGVIEALNYQDSIMLVSEALAESAENAKDFQDAIAGMIESIDNTIRSIRGNTQTQDEFTDDEIRRLNLTQRAFETSLATSDTESAQELLNEITSLSSSISSSAFGDTSLLDANLISNLEATKALISFEDEVINVNIVGSEITEPITSSVVSPSVTVTNPTNDSERLDNMEAILTQILINNKNVYDILLRIENDGIKTI